MRRDAGPAGSSSASGVQRLAVLLEAGIAPGRAWELLAEAGDPVAARVAGAPPGAAVGDTLAAERGAWTDVAVAWRVAETVGAPLASSLRRFADALRDAQETRDDVAVALADPAATARLVGWLPLVAVALSAALGFDLVSALTQPIGIACIVGGILLMLAARRWSARLVASARPGERLAGVQAETVAIALSGGVSVDRALAVVAASGGGDVLAETRDTLALAQRAGAPAVELLRAEAAESRRRARTDGRLRAARLGARLLLPMGLCTLPAFLLIGVAPMLLSVMTGSIPVLASP
ncbi:MAG: pilus assembly protein TadB [Microbacterium sp.]|nr:MAG: pilus assembly protein TadB [Microbacterium sp.]